MSEKFLVAFSSSSFSVLWKVLTGGLLLARKVKRASPPLFLSKKKGEENAHTFLGMKIFLLPTV